MSGGRSTTLGIVVQALALLVDGLNRDDWESVVLEPEGAEGDTDPEKIDIEWLGAAGRRVSQVKSSTNTVTLSIAKRWAGQLVAASEARDYELHLVANVGSEVKDRMPLAGASLRLHANTEAVLHDLAVLALVRLAELHSVSCSTEHAELAINALGFEILRGSLRGRPWPRQRLKEKLLRHLASLESAGRSSAVPAPRPSMALAGIDVAPADPSHRVIEIAEGLIDDGRPGSAAETLEKLLADSPTSPGLSASILSEARLQLGRAYHRLGEGPRAAAEFERAHALDSASPRAITNAAVAASIRGDAERARELAMQVIGDPDMRGVAVGAVVGVLSRIGRDAEAAALLEEQPWLFNEVRAALPLGFTLFRLGRVEEAQISLRRAIAFDGSPSARALLAATYSTPVFEATRGSSAQPLSEGQEQALRTAERLLSEAEERFTVLGASAGRAQVLADRAAVRALLGDDSAGLHDAEHALRLWPDEPVALRNRAELLGKLGRLDEAAEVFEHLAGVDPRPENILRSAQARARAGRSESAVAALEVLWADRPRPEVGDALVEALLDNGAVARAASVADELESGWPTDAHSLLARARVLELDPERNAEAIELLSAASESNDPRVCRVAVLHLVDIRTARGEWDEVAALLKTLVDDRQRGPFDRGLAVALFNSGRALEALEFCERRRDGGSPIADLSDVEAALLEEAGELEAALGLRRELALRDDDGWREHRYRAAALAFRLGKRDEALELASQVHFEDQDSAAEMLAVARLKTEVGVPDAVECAYEVLRRLPDSPEAHQHFLTTRLDPRLRGEPVPQPDAVAVGTAVTLRDEAGKESVWTVVDDGVEPRGTEVRASSPLGDLLIGQQAGAEVRLGSEHDPVPSTVVAIRDKYVAAFQDIGLRFGQRFPGDGRIQMVRFDLDAPPEERYGPILDVARRRRLHVERVLVEYGAVRLPLHATAEFLGKTLFEGYIAARNEPNCGLVASAAGPGEIEVERQALADAGTLVLDLPALLTLVIGDLAEALSDAGPRILVTQAVLEEIGLARLQLLQRPAVGTTVSEHSGRLHGVPFDENDRDALLELLDRVRSVATTLFEPTSQRGVLLGDRQHRFQLHEAFGPGATATILEARRRGAAIYSDDQATRRVARTLGVGSTWTQPVVERVAPDQVETWRTLGRLSNAGIGMFTVTSEMIAGLYAADSEVVSAELTGLLRNLAAPACNDDAAIAVAANALREHWTPTGADLVRPLAFGAGRGLVWGLLDALIVARDPPKVVRALVSVVGVVAPRVRDHVVGLVAMWKRDRFPIPTW